MHSRLEWKGRLFLNITYSNAHVDFYQGVLPVNSLPSFCFSSLSPDTASTPIWSNSEVTWRTIIPSISVNTIVLKMFSLWCQVNRCYLATRKLETVAKIIIEIIIIILLIIKPTLWIMNQIYLLCEGETSWLWNQWGVLRVLWKTHIVGLRNIYEGVIFFCTRNSKSQSAKFEVRSHVLRRMNFKNDRISFLDVFHKVLNTRYLPHYEWWSMKRLLFRTLEFQIQYIP